MTTTTHKDPRELPAYTVGEAAHYLRVPRATLRSWVAGRSYPVKGGRRLFRPVIDLPSGDHRFLSFVNLVEAHILEAIRREHEIPLLKVRTALRFLSDRFASKHPLADQPLETDGLDLFVDKYGQLINISRDGQLALRKLLQAHLRRIERDASGHAVRLFLFTRKRDPEEPKAIVIDPYVAFGRPVLAGTGIATAIIAERLKAGESIDSLADDYGRARSEIEEAIRCEISLDAA